MGKRLILAAIILSFLPLFSAFSEEISLEQLYFERDLELSSLDELKIWCQSLSLDDEGTASELRALIREYYDWDVLEDLAESGGNEQLEITIESADSTEYRQIDEKGEEIHLIGGVQLTVNDKKEDRVYVIKADQIVFSRLDDSITALGNVEYSRQEEEDEAETFLGESMTFHIDGWQGIIYDGVSSKTDTVDDEDVEFYFTGSKIKSSGFDKAIMENGAITSGSWEDPEYSIQAGKIWLLGAEEWGLVNGVLYLGRIPLLYLPFYYNPGNELLFNPSLGFRTREGTTIQTTTYLLGQKTPENTSFFSAGLNSDSYYELERKGLYLYKGDEIDEVDDDYIKLMADYYSRLGGFVGLEGEFTPGESSSPLEVFLGIGVSRSIDESNSYSVYYEEDDEYSSYWNSTSFGSLDLPFRWSFEFDYSVGNFDLELMYYTDPSFLTDFTSDRTENFDPLNFLLSDLGEDSTDDDDDDISSFDWELSWSKEIDTDFLSPYISSFDISSFDGSLEWSEETDESKEDDVDADDNPTVYFFYPESITFPDASFSLSGTLWSSSSDSDDSSVSDNLDEWRFPDEESIVSGESSSDSSTFDLPDLQDKKTLSTGDDFSGSLSWSSSSTVIFINDFDNFLDDDDEVTPSNISLELDKGKLSLTNKDSLSLSLDFFDELLSFDHTESCSMTYREYYDLTGDDLDLTDSELKDQYSYDSVKWYNSSDLTLNPITWYAMEDSYLQYSIDMDIYEKTYDSLDDENSPVYDVAWLLDGSDTISDSEAELYLKYYPSSNFYITSTIQSDVYTDDRDLSSSMDNSLSLTLGPLSNSMSHGIDKDGDDWTFDNLSYKATLDLSPLDLTLSNSLEWDVEHLRLDSNTTSLSGYGFSLSLDADYTESYDWDDVEYEWDEGDETFQISSIDCSYSLDWDLPSLWKNRVDMSIDTSLEWDQNLIKVNDSVLDFSLSLDLSIYEFTDLSIGMVSENENMYLYIPAYCDKLGITDSYNVFEDLAKSFNFFNTQDRYDSFFNLSSFDVDLTHDLGNWNFTLNYSGSPELEDSEYEWQSTVSFYLVWDPIPTLNIDIEKDEDEDWDISAGETD
jgi:lipopolysaccharide assembly outer membrane protein LptD (OstA)